MVTTRIFKNGNLQAVRIVAELACSSTVVEVVMRRKEGELRPFPAPCRRKNALRQLAHFSPGFMDKKCSQREETG